ncbi:MAG: hypothetical protein DGJ47_000032 [Rickettsiaceae bacterium]
MTKIKPKIMKKQINAAIIIIGNEILSGRTLDKNTQEIALTLGKIGIDIIEARTIPDNKKMIIDNIRHLSSIYDYVFTTGGIGPTHDDITAESVAEAFGLDLILDAGVCRDLEEFSHQRGEELNESRKKMAYFPKGSKLLHNKESAAPGFMVNNVCVMAGIPTIMKAMLGAALPSLRKGQLVHSKSMEVIIGESHIAKSLTALQKKYPNVEIGSYPFKKEGEHGTSLVLRSVNREVLEVAFEELESFINDIVN